MPKSLDSAGSILEAAQTVVQSRLLRSSQTAEVMLPWMIGKKKAAQTAGPTTSQTEKALFTPAVSEEAPSQRLTPFNDDAQ
ncbi:MAG: hypothetical protein EOP05_09875 [Proteobacteria bacterium]|nr:MAG: hypothetical protein EOP05_09875 [Pseudomonadota bacterium]